MSADPADAGDGAQPSFAKGHGGAGRWWRGRTWEQILAAMPKWVIAQLEIWKGFLELAEKQVRRLEMELKKGSPAPTVLWRG